MASSSIAYTLQRIYRGNYAYSRSTSRSARIDGQVKYLTIPLDTEVFELPTFVYNSFVSNLRDDRKFYDQVDSIIVTLEEADRKGPYKTLDANMKNLLDIKFSKLIKLEIENGGVYFVTNGAVFNEEFFPVAMMSWQLRRGKAIDDNGEEFINYKHIRPILRIDPICFAKNDSVQRYIVGKLLNSVLDLEVTNDSIYTDSYPILYRSNDIAFSDKVKVEIDFSPFEMRGVEIPSISTTNQSLIQVALDNIEELAV